LAVALHRSEADKAVSTLIFHQAPQREKLAGVEARLSSERPAGQIHKRVVPPVTGAIRLSDVSAQPKSEVLNER
jgi:hypothetical protein